MNNKKNIKKYFKHKTNIENYSDGFTKSMSGINFNFRKRKQIVTKFCDFSAKSILDIGPGTGEITQSVVKKNNPSHLTLIDVSEEMLRITSERILSTSDDLEIESICKDIESIRLEENKFDLVLCLGLIAYVDNLDNFLNEIISSSKPGAYIILQSSLTNNLGLKLMLNLSKKNNKAKYGFELSEYSLNNLTKAIKINNLEIIAKKRYLLSLPYANKFKLLNYFIEFLFQPLSSFVGSEIIFILRIPNDRN